MEKRRELGRRGMIKCCMLCQAPSLRLASFSINGLAREARSVRKPAVEVVGYGLRFAVACDLLWLCDMLWPDCCYLSAANWLLSI